MGHDWWLQNQQSKELIAWVMIGGYKINNPDKNCLDLLDGLGFRSSQHTQKA